MAKPKCVFCGTGAYVEPLSYCEKTGTVIGGVLGSGILATKEAAIGSALGATLGSVVPVVGNAAGGVLGGALGILTGILTGALAGGTVGSKLDDHVIRIYRCHKCGRTIKV
jgi:phage tail tape-measure protein